jgi:AraC family transcriptional regulator, regulatory protein of adaptative response / methylated-DNA-[protein]-cysteine methyltransferase
MGHTAEISLVLDTPPPTTSRIAYGFHQTAYGNAFLAHSDGGILRLEFPQEGDHPIDRLASDFPESRTVEDPKSIAALAHPIFEASTGKSSLRLLLSGTPFQYEVWQALLRIPRGHVVAYSDLARQIDRTSAHRAVASAVGRNPIAYLIPCHRVVRKSGALGGFRWGLEVKRRILAAESPRIETQPLSPSSISSWSE